MDWIILKLVVFVNPSQRLVEVFFVLYCGGAHIFLLLDIYGLLFTLLLITHLS